MPELGRSTQSYWGQNVPSEASYSNPGPVGTGVATADVPPVALPPPAPDAPPVFAAPPLPEPSSELGVGPPHATSEKTNTTKKKRAFDIILFSLVRY